LEQIPPNLVCEASGHEREIVETWWQLLSSSDRQQIAAMYDEAPEDVHQEMTDGYFLARDDAWGFEDWETDWREYLVEHPGVYLGDRWHDGSVVIASQFRSFQLVDEPPTLADWNLTRFRAVEMPPSEKSRRTRRFT
jgi:hypothetical protein